MIHKHNTPDSYPYPHYEVAFVVGFSGKYRKKERTPVPFYYVKIHEKRLSGDKGKTVTKPIGYLNREITRFKKGMVYGMEYGRITARDLGFEHPLKVVITFLNDTERVKERCDYKIVVEHISLPAMRVDFTGTYPLLTEDGRWLWSWENAHIIVLRGGE